MTAETIVLDETKERGCEAVPCPKCGGFAGEVECTAEEIRTIQTCGRSRACCIAAFVCQLCGQRIVAHLEAPEME